MATTVMTSDVAKVHAAGSESAADSESAALLRRLHAVEKRHGEAPTNFHHAAIAERRVPKPRAFALARWYAQQCRRHHFSAFCHGPCGMRPWARVGSEIFISL